MSKLRIVITDDHAVLRSGLRMLLESQADMEVVGEAFDATSALQAIQELHPDVMTVDLSMPGTDGFKLLRELKNVSPETRLVVLTMHDDPAYFRAAVSAGADGYVLKKAADNELMAGIRSSVEGQFYSTMDIDSDRAFDVTAHATDGSQPSIEQLSEREREVLTWVVQGLTNQQVADKLVLSVKTVESYRARLMHKLGLKTRAELVSLALNAGLLRPDMDAIKEWPPT